MWCRDWILYLIPWFFHYFTISVLWVSNTQRHCKNVLKYNTYKCLNIILIIDYLIIILYLHHIQISRHNHEINHYPTVVEILQLAIRTLHIYIYTNPSTCKMILIYIIYKHHIQNHICLLLLMSATNHQTKINFYLP